MNKNKIMLGIDVGGSGIKGALVDVIKGALITERYRIETPAGGKPKDMIVVINEIMRHFNWTDKIGCGFPSTIKNGTVCTAANIHKSWINFELEKELRTNFKINAKIINDADAAGIAEIKYGAGRDVKGTVLMITVGTGLGTALFTDGKLVPNTELGHIQINGEIAEKRASDAARKREDLNLKKWMDRINIYLNELDKLLSPGLFIIGGGIVKKSEKIKDLFKLQTKWEFAQFGNEAGIIGAAVNAAE